MDSELRDTIKKIGGYKNMDRCEFYYYDETNNSRMFRLKNDSFNVNPFQKFSGSVAKLKLYAHLYKTIKANIVLTVKSFVSINYFSFFSINIT